MNSELTLKSENITIPAYNFYIFGISTQKTTEEELEYIKNSVMISGEDLVAKYLSELINLYSESFSAQLVFSTILSNPEYLSKIDIVSDGSYRCNRLLFDTSTGDISLTGGNLTKLKNTNLGSAMYYGEYPLTEEGVLSWMKENERLFIQNSYNFGREDLDSEFYEETYYYQPDIESRFLIDNLGNIENSIIQYVEHKLSLGLIPYYSDWDQKSLCDLEEYDSILKSNGHHIYVF